MKMLIVIFIVVFITGGCKQKETAGDRFAKACHAKGGIAQIDYPTIFSHKFQCFNKDGTIIPIDGTFDK